MTASSIGYLAVGIASSADDRRALAQLLGDTEAAFLIVSSVEQARRFLGGVGATGAEPGEPLLAELITHEGSEPVVVVAPAHARAVAAQGVETRLVVTETVEPPQAGVD